MRGVVWGGMGLWFIASVAACGDDASVPDASVDASRDARVADADTGAALLCQSDTPGCVGACQIVHDCVVQSAQRDSLLSTLVGYGFTNADWDDCSICTERCEADVSGEGDAARACFDAQYATSLCSDAADPTQAANAINICCEGQVGSRFCEDSCAAVLNGPALLADLLPNCQAVVAALSQEPTCVGTCPAVTEAMLLPVTSDAAWGPRGFAVHTDGSIAMTGYFEAGSIDFGVGAHVATSATQVVAVFDADGTPRWSRALSGGFAGVDLSFGRRIVFDDSGNITVAAELYGTVDLGNGDLASVGESDLLIASWAPDGTLRYARTFGGTGFDVTMGVYADGSETLVIAHFDGTIDLGTGPHVSAGEADVLVVRLDAAGAVVWSRSYGGPGIDFPWSLTTHPSGDYSVVGGASTGLDFGAGPITSAGDQDSFVARWAADGTLRWAKLYGGPTWDIAYQTDAAGEAIVVADYLSSGSLDLAGTTLPGTNQPLIRIDADGSEAWANDNPQEAGRSGFVVRNVSVNAADRIEVTAVSGSPRADLGGGAHLARRSADLILASFDGSGAHRWSMRLGGPRTEASGIFVRLPTNETVLVGEMVDAVDHGAGEVVGDGHDMFVLRFAAD